MGSRLTRDKIEKLLDSQTVGNFSSLRSLGKKSSISNASVVRENLISSTSIEVPDPLLRSVSSSVEFENRSVSNPLFVCDQSVSKPLAGTALNAPTKASEENKLNINGKVEIGDLGLDANFLTDVAERANLLRTDFVRDPLAVGNESVSKSLSNTNNWLENNSVTKEIDRKIAFESTQVLAGKGLVLVMHLIDLCQKNCSLVTPPVFTKDLLQIVCVKPEHLRNLILRLSEKKFFKVLLHKSSKHAVRIFEFEKNTYISFIKRKHNETVNKYADIPIISDDMNLMCSNNHDHVDKETKIFKNLDLLPLENIGFNNTHIIQIYKEYEKNPNQKLSEEIIQQSINSFAFDLKHNDITKELRSSPAVVLLSLLKRGIPYSSKTPEKFLTPQEESMKEYLLAQEKKRLTLLEIETTTKNFVLQEWLDSLSEEELFSFNPDNNIRPTGMPEKVYQVSRRKKAIEFAKEYFDNIMWPQKRKQISNNQNEIVKQS